MGAAEIHCYEFGKVSAMIQQFGIQSKKKLEIIDITPKVSELVKHAKVKEGLCTVFVPHATAAIIINENYDPGLCKDILNWLDKVVPAHAGYVHDGIDDNAAAHIKATLLGPAKSIPIVNGKLGLGRWQGIALAEFDGPRERIVCVQISSK